jgi:hypothetical protein
MKDTPEARRLITLLVEAHFYDPDAACATFGDSDITKFLDDLFILEAFSQGIELPVSRGEQPICSCDTQLKTGKARR